MRILSVVGARPQFVKLAPVSAAAVAAGHEHVIVHTGQHYDPALSDVFFAGLGIPAPDVRLAVGSGGHGAQTGGMLAAMDPVLERYAPDWVVVYGDTNSTIAGALSAVKLHLKVAHLEAGLRSFNRRMPEEHNRILTDHAADLLLAPTRQAVEHLEREGLGARTVLVGDVMVDACLRMRDLARAAPPRGGGAGPKGAAAALGIPHGEPYLFATIHRAELTDDPERLAAVAAALAQLPVPVVLAAHPRLVARAAQHGVELGTRAEGAAAGRVSAGRAAGGAGGTVHVVDPLPYDELVAAVLGSAGVVTDSGGLQKEAYLLGRLCTTLRTETEWPETLAGGWNVLLPPEKATAAELAALVSRPVPQTPPGMPYGDGRSAERSVRELERRL